MNNTKDMTKGNPWKLISAFSLPLIVANLGQQLYMVVDASIVGRGVGIKALAAVGSSDWICWLVIWTIAGLTQGLSTFVSRYFGDKNYHMMNKTIAMSALLSFATGFIMTVLGLVFTRPVLILLETPVDIIDNAALYLRTIISGTLIIAAYNMASSVLRAFGDGKSPLIAMIIAAIVNIGLDVLFVFAFNMGVFGAALASVIAQLISFLYCFRQIKKIKEVRLDKEMWKIDFAMIKELTAFGIPIAIQYIIIATGGIVLQSKVNLEGSSFVAGYTAANKICLLLESIPISLGIAVSTYISQNYGAGDIIRVKKGFTAGFVICLGISLVVSVTMLIFGRNIITIFADVSEESGFYALDIAWNYLFYMSVFLFSLYLIHFYRNTLQAIGISVWSMVSGFSEFVVRIVMSIFMIGALGQQILFYIEPAAWVAAVVFVLFPFMYYKKRI